MDFLIGALLSFAWLYILDRLLTILAPARMGIAIAIALGVGLAAGAEGRDYLIWAASGVAGLVLSEVVSMLQVATDTMRVRVLTATRRTRVPPI